MIIFLLVHTFRLHAKQVSPVGVSSVSSRAHQICQLPENFIFIFVTTYRYHRVFDVSVSFLMMYNCNIQWPSFRFNELFTKKLIDFKHN